MAPLLAYFDPGAGSLLMQALLGGIGGVVVLVRYLCTCMRLRRAQGPGSTETSGC
jgi:hypothetical protein